MDNAKESAGPGPGGALDKYTIKDPEAFARNLARMTEYLGKAAANWVSAREKGDASDAYSDSVADVVRTMSKVSEYWLSDPRRALEAQTSLFTGYMNLWSNSIRRLSGEATPDVVETDKSDKRFGDPEWRENAFYDFLRQTYLLTANWANSLVENAEGLDEHTRHKAGFYVKQIANAVAPSNFLVTNPEVFKETIATNGENLVKGMRMLAEDIDAGHGELKIRQADYSKFAVGVNMALTPGKVVAQSDIAQIIQYDPATKDVLKRPLLICPPWINKFYILDLNPEKSFIRWAVEQGHTVFVISWVNPDRRHAEKTWEDYIEGGIVLGLDTIEKATGEREVNAVGYCVGGTLLCAALAMFARDGDDRIRTATLFTTQVDFTHSGDLKVFVDEEQIGAVENAMKQKGYLEGSKMAAAFNMLRSGDLIWPYVVNNYMKGKEPMPFDLLYWNSDSTRMTCANHSFYMRNCYLENNLVKGTMPLGGAPVRLEDVTIPVYNLAAKEDHIAPALSVFEGCKFFGGEVTYVMGGSGHIAGVINPPDKVKYQFWSDGPAKGDFADWVARAQVTPGSWWPHWHAWIERQDARRTKPRKVGGGKLKPIEDAPGSYVKVRV